MRLDPMLMLRWLIDSLLAVWFYLPLRPKDKKCGAVRGIGALLCLLAILPIYIFIDLLDWNIIRFLYRAGLYALYIRLVKRLDWEQCAYLALLGWLAFNIGSNTFLTPALRNFYFIAQPSEITAGTLLCYLGEFAAITFISRMVPFDHIQKPGKERFAFAIFLCVVQLYIKSTLNYISWEYYEGPTELSAYLILLQVLLTAAMVLWERYLYTRQLREQERLVDFAAQYRYKNAMIRHEADENIRRLHHDMKNHLMALRSITGDDQRVGSYIGDMLDDLSSYDYIAYTGNDLLDGLLAEKMQVAAAQGVELLCAADLSGTTLDDIDVCTIFGNILDNAIEAAAQVPDQEERSILLKSSRTAGQLVLTCSNYFTGKLQFAGELPQTSKDDKQNHGIGLSSVRRSVEKYGGVLSLRTEDQRLILTILIPLSL